MNPTYNFRGQAALVTGASSGLGQATATAFAEAGAAVVLADINEQAAPQARAALRVPSLSSDGSTWRTTTRASSVRWAT